MAEPVFLDILSLEVLAGKNACLCIISLMHSEKEYLLKLAVVKSLKKGSHVDRGYE